MSVIEQLERIAASNHADTAIAGVPVGMIRSIAKRLRRLDAAEAEQRANATIAGVCQGIAQ